MISDERLAQIRTRVEAQRRGRAGAPPAKDSRDELVEDLLGEVESLRDGTLAKNFVALYEAAHSLTAWFREQHPMLPPETRYRVEGVALQVTRLAPLEADVRATLNVQLAHRALPVDGPLPFVLRGAVPARPGALRLGQDIDPSTLDLTQGPILRALMTDPPPTDAERQALTALHRWLHSSAGDCELIESAQAFHEQCEQQDAEGCRQIELDERRADVEARTAWRTRQPELQVPSLLPDGVLHATPDELVDILQRQVEEHEGRGIINREALDAPPDEVAVPVVLGPTLRPRVEALVATQRLGRDIEHVVQTLFVLGMLDAEGQDPQAHVGDPMLHVSAEALFVRFGMPHEAGPVAARQRADILRQLLLDLAEWCDEADPLRPALLAGIEVLPR